MIRLSHPYWRLRPRPTVISVALFLAITWYLLAGKRSEPKTINAAELERAFPLTWKHIHLSNGTGGAWYIPPEWIPSGQSQPQNIVEAARLASNAARIDGQRQIALSNIPLLIHQTWKNTRVDTWNAKVVSWVERWLEYATKSKESPMAYFFWDDEGILAFMRQFEPDFLDPFMAFFSPVERADIFRILVCKWFGGIYGDVDTEPLRHPATWVHTSDVDIWTDRETGASYGHKASSFDDATVEAKRPVNILWGVEADTDPDSDSYWRMGYSYAVQLTQWALASAPHHPALSRFMEDLKSQIDGARKKAVGAPDIKAATRKEVRKLDPLELTGPAAVTFSTSSYLKDHAGLRWNALSGLHDGGKAKLVSDVLILPITAFSPGRGKYGNMGSKPLSDPDARLSHHAQGSWRHFDLIVEYGKFCRTMFGYCKDWSKVPAEDRL